MCAMWITTHSQRISEPVQASAWFTGDHLVALATVIGAVMAAAVAIASYRAEHQRARHERFARAFAEAIQAVEDYLEAPYRIRRRPPCHAEVQFQLTAMVSDVQSRIAFHEAWLTSLSPIVAEKYCKLVRVARQEAGSQMTDAWRSRATSTDTQVPLGEPFKRPLADAAKVACLSAMRWELTPRRQLRRRRELRPHGATNTRLGWPGRDQGT